MEDFAIHEVALAGGLLALSPLPGRAGDLLQDLTAIRLWAPRIVVSLTTAEELQAPHVTGFVTGLAAAGIAWRHFPIPDFGTPLGSSGSLWAELSVEIKSALGAGGRVLVHCQGGCGRSGMIALRLMVEMGEPPTAGLERLRQVRPCAVETEAQLDWAAGRGG